jgi:Ca2+:H+ antiporter
MELVHSVEGVIATTDMSELFIGLVIIPIIGNAAEHITAITVALKNKMDLSFSIALGSSTQIALFVAPLLVLISLLTSHHMDLVFTVPEIAAVGMATLILSIIIMDGKTNWFEGVSLLAVYMILAGAFYFVPMGH